MPPETQNPKKPPATPAVPKAPTTPAAPAAPGQVPAPLEAPKKKPGGDIIKS